MDGKGRAFDNIFIERLWRSVKYEEVYIHDYRLASEAKEKISFYFKFYNDERHHQSLNYKKPAEIYFNEEFPLEKINKVWTNNFIVSGEVMQKNSPQGKFLLV